jgi:arylsulfatase A-like enzyme
MTGTSPRDHGVHDNRTPLAEGAPTLAECFRDLGYRTWAAVSTRHLRHDVSGLGQGFDRMALPFQDDTRRAGDTLDVVEAWLADPGPPAVFLWVHLFDAHSPYDPPAEHAAAYWPSDMDPRDPSLPDPGLPEIMLAPAKLQGLRNLDYPFASYKGEVSYLDAELGRLLERAPFDTGIVAFVADHGESFGEHRIYFGHSGLYPQTIQVPLILAWPDGPRGVRRKDPVQQIDLSRTLLDLAGAEDVPFRGRSLVDRTGSPATDEAPGPRFALSNGGLGASVTAGGRHFVLHLQSHQEAAELDLFPQHAFELYDLERDPACLNDLAGSEPEVARSLHKTLVDWLQSPEDLGWAGSTSHDPELATALAELGYADAGEPPGPALWVADDCEWCRRVR